MIGFKNKTALVLNGNVGIGRKIASALQKNGATVRIIRNIEPDDTIEEIKKVLGKKSALDIFINYLPGSTQRPDAAKRGLAVETRNKRNCTLFEAALEESLAVMRRQGFGRVVNVADCLVAEYVDYMYVRNTVIAVTKTFGRRLCKENIYINAVIPCLIEGQDYSLAEKKYLDELCLNLPAGRPARMEEIVAPVLFLASEDSGYIFGQAIKVDGGLGI